MNTKKILMYNGGTQSYKSCSKPDCLIKGQLYEVVSEKDLNFQTNYTLKDIAGEFNSVWFDEPISYFAYSKTVPVEGESLKSIIRIDGINGIEVTRLKRTSRVRYIEPFAGDIYKVYTKNTLYIVKVI